MTDTREMQAPRIYWRRDGRTGSIQRRGGDRYLITRWNNRWLIHYVAAQFPGVGQRMERVSWIGDRRTLRAAQQSCAAHACRSAEKARQLAAQAGHELDERGF